MSNVISLPPRRALPDPTMTVEIPLEAFAKTGAPIIDDLEFLKEAQPQAFALMQIEKMMRVKHLLTLSVAQVDAEIERVAREGRLLTHAVNPLTAGLSHD